jgi:hypothetical protein
MLLLFSHHPQQFHLKSTMTLNNNVFTFIGQVNSSDELVETLSELIQCNDNTQADLVLYSSSTFLNWNGEHSTIVLNEERGEFLRWNGTYTYNGTAKNAISWIEQIKKEDSKYNKMDDFVDCDDGIQVYKNTNDPKFKPHDDAEIDDQGYYPVDEDFIFRCSRQMEKQRGGFGPDNPPPKMYIKRKSNKYIKIDVDQLCTNYY